MRAMALAPSDELISSMEEGEGIECSSTHFNNTQRYPSIPHTSHRTKEIVAALPTTAISSFAIPMPLTHTHTPNYILCYMCCCLSPS